MNPWHAGARCASAGLAGLALLLAGACSHVAPPRIGAGELAHDGLFEPPAQRIDATDVLAMSDAMRRYAETVLLGAGRDPRRALIDALYRPGGLRLDFDAGLTRTAAESYDQRVGNCLSLTLMTAAFARHLGLPVHFQRVLANEEYSRAGDLLMLANHVNVVIGRPGRALDARDASSLTVDFLPQVDLTRIRVQPIDEATVIAMFMNNRAVESLVAGRATESYWWARGAVRQDPQYLPGANTLGVIYQRTGHVREAENAMRYVLERDADNRHALANLTQLLQSAGRQGEAAPLAARLAVLQPHPPFWHYERALEALARGDPAAARDLLLRELRRQPYQHEVHFRLALAYHRLGDDNAAARHLALARDYSPTRGVQALYSGKLDRLRASVTH
jgi:Tfp pilus assembly protein PilF